jgi:1H-pyrrole-2-carbonyl-[peptidyl-carrier protein] chlorinase
MPEQTIEPIVIIGGGPAGSTLASYLAKAGRDVVLIDSANHPRPHVGESFLLASNKVLRDIGMWDEMHAQGFVKKHGVVWHSAHQDTEFATTFTSFPREAIDEDYTFHVDRAKFDLLMVKRAEKWGARLIQGVKARRVIFEDDAAVGVELEVAGQPVVLKASLVVDATGRGSLIGNQLRLKRMDPILNQQAIFAWYTKVDRGTPQTADYLHVHYLPVSRGWVWQIPITNEVTSVGVVIDRDTYRRTKGDGDLAAQFAEVIAMSPSGTRAISGATRINEFLTEGNYSYLMDQYVGNGYMLVGDAARFVDPIFSSGVEIALYSARFASQTILGVTHPAPYTADDLMPFQTKSKALSDVWHEFARLFYRLPSLWTFYLIKDRSQNRSHEFIKLITGLIPDERNTTILEEMRETIRMVESQPEHLWHKFLRPDPTQVPDDEVAEVSETQT